MLALWKPESFQVAIEARAYLIKGHYTYTQKKFSLNVLPRETAHNALFFPDAQLVSLSLSLSLSLFQGPAVYFSELKKCLWFLSLEYFMAFNFPGC